jgi:multidrug resistance efflux pump
MKARRRSLAARVAVAIVLIAGATYGAIRMRRGHKADDLPTAQAQKGEFAVLVNCRGNLAAARTDQLTAPEGVKDLQIIWLAPSGASVKKGDPVVRFDPSKLQQDLREKTAAFQQAQATLDQAVAQARITADQDKLDLATATFDREKARLEASKKAIVSSMEGQKSAIDLAIAEEKVKVQGATIELHRKSDEAKIASQTRLRNEARAEVDRTRQQLNEMELRSPHNGVVDYLINRTQGWMNAQPFRVGDHVSAGLAIAEIPDLSTLEMESKVDEVDRGRIAVGDEARIHVDAFPEKTFSGKLTSVSLLTEQSFTEWPPTRNFHAFASIQDRDQRLRPGMNASVDIVESRIANAITIPARALFTLHSQPVVYVKTRDGYVARQVHVKARNADEVAVEGIAANSVVTLAEPVQKKS